MIHKLEGATDE
jgi:hypothetical protein